MTKASMARRARQAEQGVETLRRALACLQMGNLDQAEVLCKAILQARKQRFDGLHLLGLVELQRGRFEQAHRLLTQAVKERPSSADAHCNLGNALRHLNRNSEAVTAFRRALRSGPITSWR